MHFQQLINSSTFCSFDPVRVGSIFLCITTHSIHTCIPFLALVVATPTVLLVRHWLHTITFAAYLSVLALLTTHSTVKPVCQHIHTLLLAAIRPGAALGTTNPRVLIACHGSPSFLS